MNKVLLLVTMILLSGCNNTASTYTLYRNSPIIDSSMRIHVATFNSEAKTYGGTSENYNRENCQLAAVLFGSQPGIVTKFWCEKGDFRE